MKKKFLALGLVMGLVVTGITGNLLTASAAQSSAETQSWVEDTALFLQSKAITYYNGHSYYLINEELSWHDAEAKAEKLGGHLATITSKEECDAINTMVEGTEIYHIWVGGTDNEKEGDWKWVTGEAWTYSKWNRKQPDNFYNNGSDEDYLEIFYKDSGVPSQPGDWNDIKADGFLGNNRWNEGYIVEIPEGYCGLLSSWHLNYGTGELTLKGVGAINNLAEEIAPYAQKIKTVTIESGITSIGENSFVNCKNLTSIIIGKGVKEIKDNAFKGCNSLTSIYYSGADETAWNKIDGHAYAEANGRTIYCYSKNAPTKAGNYWHWSLDNKTTVTWEGYKTGIAGSIQRVGAFFTNLIANIFKLILLF